MLFISNEAAVGRILLFLGVKIDGATEDSISSVKKGICLLPFDCYLGG